MDIPIDLIYPEEASNVICPQTIMDYAEFTIQSGSQLEVNLEDFFVGVDVSGATVSVTTFSYSFAHNGPMNTFDLLDDNVNASPSTLTISPTSTDFTGVVTVYIDAKDISGDFCDTFAQIQLNVLPSGILEPTCPYIVIDETGFDTTVQ